MQITIHHAPARAPSTLALRSDGVEFESTTRHHVHVDWSYEGQGPYPFEMIEQEHIARKGARAKIRFSSIVLTPLADNIPKDMLALAERELAQEVIHQLGIEMITNKLKTMKEI